MQITPYLGFDGQCREAFEFYADCLDGEIQAMFSNAESPMAGELPAEDQARIMHAHLVADGCDLMGGDAPRGHYQAPTGLMVSVHVDTVEEADRLFSRLSAGGTIEMPLQATFWSTAFAMFHDRYGVPWSINCTETP
jgi:PhnB protein